ncbi:hypothetical protein ABK040_006035 [Willaertia magna]
MQQEEISDSQTTPLGCPHYQCNVNIKSPCCSQFFGCRICHNEQAFLKYKCKVEEMDRYAVKEIKCLKCNSIQTLEDNNTTTCNNCNSPFGDIYTCNICHLYSNDPKKLIYHCDECKICRIGKREEFIHCKVCGSCVVPDHKCIPQNFHSNCPVCLENLFYSREPSTILECGHVMHKSCFKNLIENGTYTCPYCSKYIINIDEQEIEALDREIALTPLPDELKDKKVMILCNQCLKKSETNFHIFGLKCLNCGSYNTKQTI